MIVDAFTFFNELALLQLRMKELYDVVDRFVAVEATRTFSGRGKPLYLRRYRDEIEDPAGKLICVSLPGLPPLAADTETGRFWLEAYQRNAIMQGLLQCGLQRDDHVIVSDVDEVPSAEAVEAFAARCGRGDVVQFSQVFLKYYFDDDTDDGYNRCLWGGSVGVRYATFGRALPQDVRRVLGCGGEVLNRGLAARRGVGIVEEGGWHFSSFGGKAFRDYKLSHYAHGVGRPLVLDPEARQVLRGRCAEDAEIAESALEEALARAEATVGHRLPRTVARDPRAYARFFRAFDAD